MTTASLLTIGDEILLGEILDTNSHWLARELASAGVDLKLRMSVGDTLSEMEEALDWLWSRSRLILLTGGLGPTRDDRTKELISGFFSMPLHEHPEALAALEEKLKRRGREMNDLVRTQALHPNGADYIPNQLGTAPGIWVEIQDRVLVAMPGVPYEMKAMVTDFVLPRIREKFQLDWIAHRFIRTVGVPETHIALQIADLESSLPEWIKLAYLPSGGQVKLRLTARAPKADGFEPKLEHVHRQMADRLGDWVYARTDVELAEVVTARLLPLGWGIQLSDSVSENRLAAWLRHQSPVSIPVFDAMEPPAGLPLIRVSVEAEGEQVRFQIAYPGEAGPVEEFRLRSFPVPDLNRNMAALQVLKHILDRLNEGNPGN